MSLNDESDKEKVFVLEQQNVALAKQFFFVREENTSLKSENERQCSRLQIIQSDCYSYQSLLQMVYNRVTSMINLFTAAKGLPQSQFKSTDILNAFGTEILGNEAVERIANFPVVSTNESQQVSDSSMDSKRIKSELDQGLRLLVSLDQLNQFLQIPTDPMPSIMSTRNDAYLQSAVVSAGKRLEEMQRSVGVLQTQLRRVQREKAALQMTMMMQPTSPAVQPIVHQDSTTSPAVQPIVHQDTPTAAIQPIVHQDSTTSPAVQPIIHQDTPTAAPVQPIIHQDTPTVAPVQPIIHQDSSTSPAVQPIVHQDTPTAAMSIDAAVTAESEPDAMRLLRLRLESREEEVRSLEEQVTILRNEVSRCKELWATQETVLREHERKAVLEAESLRTKAKTYEEMNGEGAKAAERCRNEVESLLSTVDERLKSEDLKHEDERKRLEDTCRTAEQTAHHIQAERDAFEKKLKRRKLFAEALDSVERVIATLKNVTAWSSPPTGESAHVAILKQQLREMGEAFKVYDSTLTRLKKLIEFGDRKNDQLLADFLELQRVTEEQKQEASREKDAAADVSRLLSDTQADNAQLRSSNQEFECVTGELRGELSQLRKEVAEVVAGEDTFQRRWQQEATVADHLRRHVEELTAEASLQRANMKRDRARFEQRLVASRGDEEKEILDLLQDAMRKYKSELMCPMCKVKPKDCILAKCQHIFCRDCVEERISRRERKCPRCLQPFGVDDVKRVWIINDPQLYEDLKSEGSKIM